MPMMYKGKCNQQNRIKLDKSKNTLIRPDRHKWKKIKRSGEWGRVKKLRIKNGNDQKKDKPKLKNKNLDKHNGNISWQRSIPKKKHCKKFKKRKIKS